MTVHCALVYPNAIRLTFNESHTRKCRTINNEVCADEAKKDYELQIPPTKYELA